MERFDELLSIMEERLFELAAAGTAGVDPRGVYLLGAAPAWPDYVLFHALMLIEAVAAPCLICNFPNVVRGLPPPREREWAWWTHAGGGSALAFKQPT